MFRHPLSAASRKLLNLQLGIYLVQVPKTDDA